MLNIILCLFDISHLSLVVVMIDSHIFTMFPMICEMAVFMIFSAIEC